MMGPVNRRVALGLAAVCLAAMVAGAQTVNPTTGAPTTEPAGTAEQSQAIHNPITGSTTAPAATVDNPMYAGWAKWKVGSAATYALNAPGPGGQKISGTASMTLRSVGATGATLDTAVTMAGRTMPGNPATFPAKVDAGAAQRTDTAEVSAMGKAFKCEVYEVSPAALGTAGGNGSMTVYVSPDVPGGIVKGVAHQPGQADGTMVLTGVEAK